MIDVHSHILPNFDDGAKDEETALAMLALAFENGTGTIVATPHVMVNEWLPEWETVVAECDRLAQLATAQGTDITICPGAEVAMEYDILEKLEKPGPYCINGSRYILVELPANYIPAYADEFFFILQTRGFYPILAHPERNPELAHRPERLVEWIEKGILVQMNGTSITGKMGSRVMKFAEQLVVRRMVHCLGSDAHGLRTRRPKLTDAFEKISDLRGKAAAEAIAKQNPAKVLRGEEITIPEIAASDGGGVVSRLIRRLWKN
ncbi:MAG: Protein-tyrosine-phosphatase [Firmicutes bacterium]|nr:Protein-tyrosine-phosphatase [Bacillota bacterium]